MKYFKSTAVSLICLFALAYAGYSRADDVVGAMRVDANTNGLVEVEMPFEPMGNTGPSGFVAGLFMGDGSLSSDLLFCRSAGSGVLTNAVWNWKMDFIFNKKGLYYDTPDVVNRW